MWKRLKAELDHLWTNEDGFFGIGYGPNQGQKSEAGAEGAIGNFATSEGEADIGASDKFWQAILSGDPGQISKVLGPELSAVNKQAQQSKKTSSEFGNRGGGTNAGAQMTDDNVKASINGMIAKLTSKAADTLGGTGGGLLSTGLTAHNAAFGADTTIHDENEAKWNDIFSSAASVAAAPFTGGASLASISKPPSGGGNGTGGGASGDFASDVTDY
jgi:hypothetical protein